LLRKNTKTADDRKNKGQSEFHKCLYMVLDWVEGLVKKRYPHEGDGEDQCEGFHIVTNLTGE
jgi:hypothetical protein